MPSLLKARKEIIETAKNARLSEGKQNVDEAFEYWDKTSKLIDDFEVAYFNSDKVSWAQKQSFFHFSSNFWIGVITGIISSLIVSMILKLFFGN